MYSVVLMVAATSGGDMASFGNKGGCSGCDGHVASCNGGGFLGLKDKMGCNGGGFLGHKDKGSCHGTPTGCSGSCHGTTIVHSAPAGCSGSCHGCSGSSCHGGKFLGGGGGLVKKKKGGCDGGCYGCSGW